MEALVARGLLHRHDKFNNTITKKGLAAVKAREDVDARDLLAANNALVRAKYGGAGSPGVVSSHVEFYPELKPLIDIAAKALFEYARSLPDFENYKVGALTKAHEAVLKRALEFL